MGIFSDIFTGGADQAQVNSQSTDGSDAQVAPPPPVLPGTEAGSIDSGGDMSEGKAPDMLMPGGPMDPEA